jgi:hypothetical protein
MYVHTEQMSMYARRQAVLILFVALLLSSCAARRYQSAPIIPAETASRLQSANLGDRRLQAFLEKNIAYPLAPWPPKTWSLGTLSLATTVGAGLLPGRVPAFVREDEKSGRLTKGDAAILRFLAAAEILETDLWVQYNELGGVQDNEVPGGSGSAQCTLHNRSPSSGYGHASVYPRQH